MPQRLVALSRDSLHLMQRLWPNREFRVDRLSPEFASTIETLSAKDLVSCQHGDSGHVTVKLTEEGERLCREGYVYELLYQALSDKPK